MNNYTYLKENIDTITELVKRGVVSLTIIRDLDIYQAFLELAPLSHQGRYSALAYDFQLSEKRIEQIILALSK